MSYEIYKVVHFLGIFSLFFAYGGLVMFYHRGGPKTDKSRKMVSALHGVALFLILLGGFGMIARLGIAWPFPVWIWIKIAVWLAMGGLIVLARKMPDKIWPLYAVIVFTGWIAALAAVYKPGG